MTITKKLVPLEGQEEDRKVEIFDSTVPTKVLDEKQLKQEKENTEQDIERSTTRLNEINADLATIEAKVGEVK